MKTQWVLIFGICCLPITTVACRSSPPEALTQEQDSVLSEPPIPNTAEASPDEERPRGWLGVALEAVEGTGAAALGFEHDLVRITEIFPNSAAASSDLLTGDLVLRFGDEALTSPRQLVELVGGRAPGDTITLLIQRDGDPFEQPFMLGIRPDLAELQASLFRGQPAPAIVANYLADDTAFSMESLAGHRVVIDFWATWCGPCRRLLPRLNQLQTMYQDRGLRVIGLSSEPLEVIDEFMTRHAVTFPMLYDLNEETKEAYFISAFPTLFLVDEEGVVRDVLVGRSPDEIVSLITAFVEEEPLEPQTLE